LVDEIGLRKGEALYRRERGRGYLRMGGGPPMASEKTKPRGLGSILELKERISSFKKG